MNIAVIGSGVSASVYVAGFAIAGHEVFFAQKESDHTVHSPVLNAFANIHFCSIGQASAESDIILVAAPVADVREIAYWLGDVRGKVILDISAQYHRPGDAPMNTIGAIKSITGSSDIVKVFNTRGWQQMLQPILKSGKLHLLLAGDSPKAKEVAMILARDIHISHFLDFGGGDAIRQFEAMTRCWCELKYNGSSRNGRPTVHH